MLQRCCRDVPPQGGQPVLDCAVQLGALDVQADAAQHTGVDLGRQVDLLPGDRLQLLAQLLGLRGNDEKLLTASFAEDIPFTRFDNGAAAEATVYALPGSDAEPLTYGLYMGGDIAETVIRTDRPELPNALIFGDSFTNPVECLAYYSFNELRSVDLRHYTVQSLSDYIAAYQPDVVLCVRDYQSLLLREFNGDFFS